MPPRFDGIKRAYTEITLIANQRSHKMQKKPIFIGYFDLFTLKKKAWSGKISFA
jgi:hypothetical protein